MTHIYLLICSGRRSRYYFFLFFLFVSISFFQGFVGIIDSKILMQHSSPTLISFLYLLLSVHSLSFIGSSLTSLLLWSNTTRVLLFFLSANQMTALFFARWPHSLLFIGAEHKTLPLFFHWLKPETACLCLIQNKHRCLAHEYSTPNMLISKSFKIHQQHLPTPADHLWLNTAKTEQKSWLKCRVSFRQAAFRVSLKAYFFWQEIWER